MKCNRIDVSMGGCWSGISRFNSDASNNDWSVKMVKNLLLIIMLVTISFTGRAQGRQVLSLDGEWEFAIDSLNKGVEENWQTGISDESLKIVTVPHTWNIEDGTEDYAGWAWYQKEIEIPQDWKNKNIRLKFGAVYHDAVIYINGEKAGENLDAGYTPFTIDISELVVLGSKNTIVVAVNNEFSETNFPYKRSFDWVNDGGITRSVSLEVTGKPSLRYVHVTPELNLQDSTGTAKIACKLWEDGIKRVKLSFVFKNKISNEIIHSEEKELKVNNGVFVNSVDAGKIQPWHFDSPNLYELKTSIISKDKITDSETSVFGFKKVEIKGESLLLNGEVVRLPGIEYMPGSSPVYGIAEPKSYMDSIVRTMKDLNICITRFHWQQDDYMLSLMDQYGILVQEELPWWQNPAGLTPELMNTAKKQLGDMIEAHYNHPSVFSWGISNEVNGETDREKYIQLRDFVRGLDSSRFVTIVSNRIWQKKENDETLLCDIPTWNEYIGTWHGKDRNKLPGKLDTVKMAIGDRPLLITENGLCEPAITGGDARRIDDMLFHTKEWRSQPYIIGYIYFCLSDYRTQMGEEGFGKYRIRRHGITDVFLNPKPSYSVLKQIASPIEITKVERVDNSTAAIEIAIKDDIPSYALRGYSLEYKSIEGDLCQIDLPVLMPGDTFSTDLEMVNASFSFRILRPNGFCVIEY
ncbi:glycoside hydrolase family 2 protein [Sunxiuqinia indica]|uniref:glycoside hydrolase family 2 protein n=1 Tax=Sunxiuqinia indica TaxID=2692584 RepID=UPI00135AED56|nr:sugar-binding domain-containing protein [Sunxiuqinia indica]